MTGTWWTEPMAPGESRIDRLCYMVREVLTRYDDCSCEIVVDGRRVVLTIEAPDASS